MTIPRSVNQGHTLVEVLIAAAILLVGITGASLVLPGGTALNQRQMLRRRALQECERILEDPLYSYSSYLEFHMNPGTYALENVALDDRGTSETSDDQMSTGRGYKVTTVQVTIQGQVVPAKHVQAKIVWAEEGETKAESLSTMITLININ